MRKAPAVYRPAARLLAAELPVAKYAVPRVRHRRSAWAMTEAFTMPKTTP